MWLVCPELGAVIDQDEVTHHAARSEGLPTGLVGFRRSSS